jgi:hypothetical protein
VALQRRSEEGQEAPGNVVGGSWYPRATSLPFSFPPSLPGRGTQQTVMPFVLALGLGAAV